MSNLKILFDTNAINNDFSTGWGFSVLIDDEVLFDTGENAQFFINNAALMNIDLGKIKSVVISHDHWDHTGGLEGLLKHRNNLTVYGCPGFSKDFKNKVKKYKAKLYEVALFKDIQKENFPIISEKKDIVSSGEIEDNYKGLFIAEQCLIIKQENNYLTVLTGCAHPGIVNMLEKIKSVFKNRRFKAVIGGFHLKGKENIDIEKIADSFQNLGVEKVAATHCSGKTAEDVFKKRYKDNFIEIKTGQSFNI